ncbi:MurR/RpiR family transcriptional regulator [Nocardioides sp. Kera G14]|uniref:MurR/RpiR family transcriptional regulator n=1 Tax=Nocardioides sp. Kera G14 TaxID=2884264 RepID=UPI001D0FD786|nr:MurR/RpiR family transcriptional regulator [Nocardioides sp. Kera G14]UDY22860.1 MurR/RpiR family transcriptional regulator [Nocardioides sp. Kera G14]
MTDMRLDERIARHRSELSPQERRAADTLLAHLDDLATYRAAELADLAGVSKATMSRLFRSLGFAGFDEVRDHLRTLRSAGLPQRVDGTPDMEAIAANEAAHVAAAVSQPRIGEAIEWLAKAERVLILGWRGSFSVALQMRHQLVQARNHVTLGPFPGQAVGEEIASLRPGDVLVLYGFRRRPRTFGALLERAASTGAKIILIADPTALPHVPLVDLWLECQVETTLAFDSYSAPSTLTSVIADGVLSTLGSAAHDRVSRIAGAYQEIGEVE